MSQEYPWQKPYHQALLENDPAKLQRLIWQTEDAMQTRLKESTELRMDEAVQMEQASVILSSLALERIGRNILNNKAMTASH
ncbi:MAG TPA: hypothetical protein VK525_15965 [Candidatus Saccharimonadales bacterium]|nr:hypothetical protein [Candidatus Saccharimonadales bacterium]